MRPVLEARHLFIPITAAEYAGARDARRSLLHALAIEEKFNLVMANYEELEHDLLGATLQSMLYDIKSWSEMVDEVNVLGNRRLMNLLATCRLYLHQVCQDLNAAFARDSAAAEAVVKQTNVEYDANVGYCVMEAIRDYIQHRSLPVRGVMHQGQWRGEAGESLCVHTIKLTLSTPDLETSKLKRVALDKLRPLGDSPDIKPLVRDYIAGLGRVHAVARAELERGVPEWERVIRDLVERYQRGTGEEKMLGLAVAGRSEAGEYVDPVQIAVPHMERRRALARKNRSASHYPRHVVASE